MTGETPAGATDGVSEEVRLIADRVRLAAEDLPSATEIGDLADAVAAAPGGDMSPADIRRLAADAVAQAQQVARLLVRLATLLDEPPGKPS